MIVACCNLCKSDLLETGKMANLECIACGNEFNQQDATLIEMTMSEIHDRLAVINGIIGPGTTKKSNYNWRK